MPEPQPSYAQAHAARKLPSPSKVVTDKEKLPSSGMEMTFQVPVPRQEKENKLSGTEGGIGQFHDDLRFPQNKGRRFHEEETKLTKI